MVEREHLKVTYRGTRSIHTGPEKAIRICMEAFGFEETGSKSDPQANERDLSFEKKRLGPDKT
jgi:hypothetical protein